MPRIPNLPALCLALITLPAMSHACPWAGGAFEFREHGINGDFVVNADCTELVWDRLSDGPETAALARTKNGWKGELEKADVELLEDGEHLRLTGTGGPMRQFPAKRLQ
ncbi:MAG: hypothetical protein GJ676_17255 [Rhodobacteraceae bacterium]|nr:hypothetical protein [Paracoccaceae bacterium]